MINLESPLAKIARTISEQYNINVVFQGNVPCTDGKTIFLPNITNLSEEELQKFRTFIFHEVAHCLYTKFPEMKKLKGEFHKRLFNALEDSRIELKLGEKYIGAKIQLNNLNNFYRQKLAEQFAELPMAVRIMTNIRNMVDGLPTFKSNEHEDSILREIIKAGLIREAQASKDSKTTIEVTKKMVDLIGKEVEEEEKKKEEKKKKDKEKKKRIISREKAKDLEESDEDDSDSEEEVLVPEESDDDSKEESEDRKSGEEILDESDFTAMIDIHSDMEKTSQDKIEGEVAIRGYIPYTKKYDQEIPVVGSRAFYKRVKDKIIGEINSTVANLERVLKVQDFASYKTEQENGRLDPRTFSKLLINKTFRQAFKDKKKVESKNVAVELLVDLSGSMSGGSKGRLAEETAVILAESLTRMGIAFEVTGFNSKPHRGTFDRKGIPNTFQRIDYANHYYIFKAFANNDLSGLSEIQSNITGENVDGESVLWAAQRLAKRKEKRKILMVLSDGLPACASDVEQDILRKDLKETVKDITKAGVETIGIGIMSNSVKYFYPKHVVVSAAKNLAKTTMNELRKLLEKGNK